MSMQNQKRRNMGRGIYMEEKAYKKAYLRLFNEITDTIEHLKEIQQQTEEIIIAMDEDETE